MDNKNIAYNLYQIFGRQYLARKVCIDHNTNKLKHRIGNADF